jgi:hypothetical protein
MGQTTCVLKREKGGVSGEGGREGGREGGKEGGKGAYSPPNPSAREG